MLHVTSISALDQSGELFDKRCGIYLWCTTFSIIKEQKNFRVQVLFQVTDLGLYAADLHGTKTVQLVI